MMGKLQSKHECFFVSADLNKAIEDKIWKKKTGYNLANYNMDETLSELSICLEEKTDTSPLRVDLPPQKLETETSKVLKLDHMGIGSHGNNDSNEKTKLNIEEFECGVQFESSENAKQEWSFTLYDFDGHGRITKEDLASLLKALYDAVGSSIKLPPNGAKTLKLRLSVGQDSTTQIQAVTNPKSSERSRNTNKAPKNKVREFSKLNNLTRTQVKCTNENQGQVAMLTSQDATANQNQSELRIQGQSSQQATNQLSVPDHQQLADLVQENMERNQIRQLRRHHSDSRNDGQQHHKRRHRNTGTHCPVTTACAALTATLTAATSAEAGGGGGGGGGPGGGGNAGNGATGDTTDDRPKESQDRRNYYLDLAGVENNNSKFQNNPTVPVAGSGCVRTGSGHHRSRSHDVATGTKCDNLHSADNKCDAVSRTPMEKCDNVRRESERLGNKLCNGKLDHQHLRSKSFDPQEVTGQTRSPKGQHQQRSGSGAANTNNKHSRFRPVSLPGHVPVSVSPHYHRRHRHREKDHDMAMQQVAQWIEREHAWDMDGDRLIVQRHEHHHIHEHHHHHHYHHYYEA